MKNPWKEIQIPSKDISALRVNPDHPLDLYWAMDHIGRYLFIYEYPTDSDIVINNPPELEGIEIISMSILNNKSRLVLILNDKVNWELFLALCNDLLNSSIYIKSPKIASTTILKRLIRWKDFLKKKRSDLLSEEIIKGLIGELLFLIKYLEPKYGIENAIKFWIGPEGTPQDFNVNNSAIEVKCQGGGTAPNVKISSAEQLSTQLDNLYLYVVTLGKSTFNSHDVINLPELIEKITILLGGNSQYLSIFQDKLLEIGYFYSEKYLDFTYTLTGENFYDVKDDFPRIISANLKQGIIRLTYNISLADCSQYEINITEVKL